MGEFTIFPFFLSLLLFLTVNCENVASSSDTISTSDPITNSQNQRSDESTKSTPSFLSRKRNNRLLNDNHLYETARALSHLHVHTLNAINAGQMAFLQIQNRARRSLKRSTVESFSQLGEEILTPEEMDLLRDTVGKIHGDTQTTDENEGTSFLQRASVISNPAMNPGFGPWQKTQNPDLHSFNSMFSPNGYGGFWNASSAMEGNAFKFPFGYFGGPGITPGGKPFGIPGSMRNGMGPFMGGMGNIPGIQTGATGIGMMNNGMMNNGMMNNGMMNNGMMNTGLMNANPLMNIGNRMPLEPGNPKNLPILTGRPISMAGPFVAKIHGQNSSSMGMPFGPNGPMMMPGGNNNGRDPVLMHYMTEGNLPLSSSPMGYGAMMYSPEMVMHHAAVLGDAPMSLWQTPSVWEQTHFQPFAPFDSKYKDVASLVKIRPPKDDLKEAWKTLKLQHQDIVDAGDALMGTNIARGGTMGQNLPPGQAAMMGMGGNNMQNGMGGGMSMGGGMGGMDMGGGMGGM